MSADMPGSLAGELAPAPRRPRWFSIAQTIETLSDVRSAGRLYVDLLFVMAIPILIWPIPRAWDLVNHWARLTLYGLPASDPLNALYQVKFGMIPNLGIDLIYLALAPLLSPQSVVRLAWAASFLLPAWGAWRLHRALFPQPQLTILLVPLLSYNLVVTAGLVNFAFGIGVALHALAWWITLDRRRIALRIVVFNALAVAMLLCHVAALAAFGVALGMIEATPRVGESWREPLRRCVTLPFYVAAALALMLFVEPPESRFVLDGYKFLIFIAPVFTKTFSDVAMIAGIGWCLIKARESRGLTVAPALRWMLVGFAALVIVLPSARGAAVFLDARLAVFWAYVAVACLGWEWSGRPARWVPLFVIVLSVTRVGLMFPSWQTYNARAEELRASFAAIPPGARALVALPADNVCGDPDMPFEVNLANFAIIDRHAMASTLFTGRGMQPVRIRDPQLTGLPWSAIDARWLSAGTQAQVVQGANAPDWAPLYAHWRDHFDTLIALHGRCAWRPDEPGLRRIAQGSVADVYDAR